MHPHRNYRHAGIFSTAKESTFRSSEIRRNFIRRVYKVLSLQFIVTSVVMMIVQSNPVYLNFVASNFLVWVLLSLFFLVAVIVFKYSLWLSYLLLFGFNVTEGLSLSVISSVYTTESILMCMALSGAIFTCLSIYAHITTHDYSANRDLMLSMLLTFICFMMVGYWAKYKIVETAIATLGAFIFSVFIVYDTQRMVSEKYIHITNPFDYIDASVILYLDIINLFIYFLRLFGQPSFLEKNNFSCRKKKTGSGDNSDAETGSLD